MQLNLMDNQVPISPFLTNISKKKILVWATWYTYEGLRSTLVITQTDRGGDLIVHNGLSVGAEKYKVKIIPHTMLEVVDLLETVKFSSDHLLKIKPDTLAACRYFRDDTVYILEHLPKESVIKTQTYHAPYDIIHPKDDTHPVIHPHRFTLESAPKTLTDFLLGIMNSMHGCQREVDRSWKEIENLFSSMTD